MRSFIVKKLQNMYVWYEKNILKVLFIAAIFALSYLLTNLPYINIFTSLFSFLPIVLAWVATIALFSIKKRYILFFGLSLFLIDIIFAFLRLTSVLEITGEISYLCIFTYIVMSFYEK